MRKIKSYSSIWKFERVLYSLENVPLLVPLTFTQAVWFAGTEMAVLFFLKKIPLLCYIDNFFIRYLIFPAGLTWFMSKKTFDGKKPYHYLKSAVSYLARPKLTYAGKRVVLRRQRIQEDITIVRCERHVPDKIH